MLELIFELAFKLIIKLAMAMLSLLFGAIGLVPYIYYSVSDMLKGEKNYRSIMDCAEVGLELLFIILIAVLVVMIAILIVSVLISICKKTIIVLKTRSIEKERRTMIIVDKNYSSPSTTYVMTWQGIMLPMQSSPEYEVTLKDANGYKTLSSRTAYENFKVGDHIDVIVKIRKDKRGNVISEKITNFFLKV